MIHSHQAEAKSKRDVAWMEMATSKLYRTVHTKQKQFCFRLNGLQSYSSESESDVAFAFAFAWCEQTINMNSPTKINGTHLVADANAQCARPSSIMSHFVPYSRWAIAFVIVTSQTNWHYCLLWRFPHWTAEYNKVNNHKRKRNKTTLCEWVFFPLQS